MAEVDPQPRENPVGPSRLIRLEEQEGAGSRLRRGGDALALLVREELHDRRLPAAFCVHADPGQPPPPELLLDEGLEPVDFAARQLRRVVDREALDDAAGRYRLLEGTEPALAEDLGQIEELELDARIGPIDAETRHRLGVREARERALELDAEHVPPGARGHLFQHLDHFLDADERHLQVDLGELELPVRPQVLVAEAAGDLEVAIEAGDHQQLLQQLRRLRQRVELARLEPARHEEVACALGSRPREDGGFDLEEVLCGERPTR